MLPSRSIPRTCRATGAARGSSSAWIASPMPQPPSASRRKATPPTPSSPRSCRQSKHSLPSAVRGLAARDRPALVGHLQKVGASGETVALSRKLQLGAKDKLKLVRARLDQWLGGGRAARRWTSAVCFGLIRLAPLTRWSRCVGCRSTIWISRHQCRQLGTSARNASRTSWDVRDKSRRPFAVARYAVGMDFPERVTSD